MMRLKMQVQHCWELQLLLCCQQRRMGPGCRAVSARVFCPLRWPFLLWLNPFWRSRSPRRTVCDNLHQY